MNAEKLAWLRKIIGTRLPHEWDDLGASSDVIPELLVEIDDLRAIVDKLAEKEPLWGGHCVHCNARRNWPATERDHHDKGCVYLRALLYVRGKADDAP